MGTMVGHVAPGFGFLVVGLWHLFNHIRLHALHPSTYTSFPWFPTKKLRQLELFLIMAGSCLSIAMELFIGPDRHQPFDPDGTIPPNHLQNFEHSSISLCFLIYAAFAVLLDQIRPRAHVELVHLLLAMAFAQQFLLFRLHSADHMGVEGQYHHLLQLVVFVSLTTTLMGIALPMSFSVSFVRSLSIFFQGVWFMVMGIMLWTPKLIPKGCLMNLEKGHYVVRCHGDHALHRAKALVNLQFSWFLTAVSVFAVVLYLALDKLYAEKVEYRPLEKMEEEEAEDLESQKKGKLEESTSFIHIGKALTPIDIER